MSLLFCLCVCVQYLGSHVLVVLFVCVCSVLRVTCPCCFVCVCVQYLGSHVLVVLFVCVFGA